MFKVIVIVYVEILSCWLLSTYTKSTFYLNLFLIYCWGTQCILSYARPSPVYCLYGWLPTQKKIKFVTQLILKILLIHWFEVLWARLSILYANYSKCLNKIITSVDIQPHSKNWFHTSTHSLNIEISEILQSDSLTIFSIIAQKQEFLWT